MVCSRLHCRNLQLTGVSPKVSGKPSATRVAAATPLLSPQPATADTMRPVSSAALPGEGDGADRVARHTCDKMMTYTVTECSMAEGLQCHSQAGGHLSVRAMATGPSLRVWAGCEALQYQAFPSTGCLKSAP